jgi:hypothetical protein
MSIRLLHLQFPDFYACLLPTCCWQKPPMCHPVTSTDCYFCIISNDYLTFHEARCPPWTALWPTELSNKLQGVQCYSTLWQVTIFHIMLSGISP